MSSKGAASILPEMFRFGLYKPNQGRLVRQSTVIAISLIAAFGCFTLSTFAFGNEDQMTRLGIPLAIWAVVTWIAFRAVNVPRFADFLVAVESEIERVVWPTWKQVWQSTVVVIVTMLFFGIFLFVIDWAWRLLFTAIHFIEYVDLPWAGE